MTRWLVVGAILFGAPRRRPGDKPKPARRYRSRRTAIAAISPSRQSCANIASDNLDLARGYLEWARRFFDRSEKAERIGDSWDMKVVHSSAMDVHLPEAENTSQEPLFEMALFRLDVGAG